SALIAPAPSRRSLVACRSPILSLQAPAKSTRSSFTFRLSATMLTAPAASMRSSWIRSMAIRGVRVALPPVIHCHQWPWSTRLMKSVRPRTSVRICLSPCAVASSVRPSVVPWRSVISACPSTSIREKAVRGRVSRKTSAAWPLAAARLVQTAATAISRFFTAASRWRRYRLDAPGGAGRFMFSRRAASNRPEIRPIAAGVVDIMVGDGAQTGDLFVAERAQHPPRRAQHQRAVRDRLAFGDQRVGSDQAVAADPRTVENDRLDADQRSFADRAPVQHHQMADRNRWAQRQGHARIGMQHRAVLDVGSRTDGDRVVVAANDDIEPDRRLAFEDDV